MALGLHTTRDDMLTPMGLSEMSEWLQAKMWRRVLRRGGLARHDPTYLLSSCPHGHAGLIQAVEPALILRVVPETQCGTKDWGGGGGEDFKLLWMGVQRALRPTSAKATLPPRVLSSRRRDTGFIPCGHFTWLEDAKVSFGMDGSERTEATGREGSIS